MEEAQQMNTEAHQHLQMARLLRRKALLLSDPTAMRRKANSFLALAKMAAKHAESRTQARVRGRHRAPQAPGLRPVLFGPKPPANQLPPRSVSPATPPSLARPQAPIRTTLLDPRKLLGPMA
jgi:hypothetical protein